MNQETKESIILIIYPIITFILCVINAVYHMYTDWQIANILYPNIDFHDSENYPNYTQVTMHSLYLGHQLFYKLTPFYFVIIFLGSGILTMYFFHLFFSKIKIPNWLKMVMIIIWVIKIPIPIYLSSLIGTSNMLFYW